MKNLIICLLFSCSFLLGNFALANCELNGVTEVIIVAPKTGQTACVFELPKGYSLKNNTVKIIVRQGKGNIVYSEVSRDLIIALPPTLAGKVHVTLKFEDFALTQQITL